MHHSGHKRYCPLEISKTAGGMPKLNYSYSYSFMLSRSICFSWNQNPSCLLSYVNASLSFSLPRFHLPLPSLLSLFRTVTLCYTFFSPCSLSLSFSLPSSTSTFIMLISLLNLLLLNQPNWLKCNAFSSTNINFGVKVSRETDLAWGCFFKLFIPPLLYTWRDITRRQFTCVEAGKASLPLFPLKLTQLTLWQ